MRVGRASALSWCPRVRGNVVWFSAGVLSFRTAESTAVSRRLRPKWHTEDRAARWIGGRGLAAGVAASGLLNGLPQRTKTATLMAAPRVQNAQNDVAPHVSSFELAR